MEQTNERNQNCDVFYFENGHIQVLYYDYSCIWFNGNPKPEHDKYISEHESDRIYSDSIILCQHYRSFD